MIARQDSIPGVSASVEETLHSGHPAVFDFDPQQYVDQFQLQGFVHIPGGVSKEFFDYAVRFAEKKVEADDTCDLQRWQFKGKKRQYLFEFQGTDEIPADVYRSVAEVADFQVARMMIGERHLKIYDEAADVSPPPHKDRLASQVTVGVGLKIPPESKLILFPDHELTVNPYMSTKEWREHLDERHLPETLLAGVEPVEIDMRAGDVVMFAGNSIYHERIRPANTWVLYMKFNAMRLDPLGEDPQTVRQRKRSLEILQACDDLALLDRYVEVSPRLEKVGRYYTRLHWREVLHGYILGEKPFQLSEDEFRAIRVMNGSRTPVRGILLEMGFPTRLMTEFVPMFRRMAELGAIDFVDNSD